MLVKIGEKIYDSGEEPISVVLSSDEKLHILRMPPQDDILTCAPVDYPKEALHGFNEILTKAPAAKVEAELVEPLAPDFHKNFRRAEAFKRRTNVPHEKTVQGDGIP